MAEQGTKYILGCIELAAEIVAAYVSNNPVPTSELPNLIRSVHGAISGLASDSLPGIAAPHVEVEKPSAADCVEKLGTELKQHCEARWPEKVILSPCPGCAAEM